MQFYVAVVASYCFLIGLWLHEVPQQVHALPNGAPVCTVDQAAPASLHLTRGAAITGTGPLSTADFNVTFNDIDLSSLSTIVLDPSTPTKVEVIANGVPMKGVLIIVSKPFTDLSSTFSLSTEEAALLQVSAICAAEIKGGVTHNDESFKTAVSATMTFDQAYTDLKLDVNVVVQNNETGSYYYYDQYTFSVTAPTAAPASGPSGGGGCGLFGLSIFCPLNFCGFFGRLLFGDRDC